MGTAGLELRLKGLETLVTDVSVSVSVSGVTDVSVSDVRRRV